MSSHTQQPSDRSAAVTGLVVGAVLVFAILFTVVKVTNASFAGEKAEGAAEATK